MARAPLSLKSYSSVSTPSGLPVRRQRLARQPHEQPHLAVDGAVPALRADLDLAGNAGGAEQRRDVHRNAAAPDGVEVHFHTVIAR